MKKKGSVLIEIIAGITILTLATTFIVSASIENLKVLKKRILSEEVNRTIYNLMNEVKYNTSSEQIEELLEDGEISFKYSENISNILLMKQIEDLDRGEEIKISIIGEDDIGLKLKIEANVKKEENEINIEKDFNKSWWMNEIQNM